ncbi:hypothetical protein CONPUDRAFT_164812 [Coniophora puteana RWD-64-598 SS2]|uniref:Glucosidase 2 subunit beta n=1 Tax=Coniophora puteana (strain RWD-64-598) TaxID=741705 RepID=A0A5M3MU06_CONPW|nr:uncharacterized protein CONPUDRAFT_164812 [Coniophora puteana RWD-64-598 SS2]EIW82175.1 hypothetical protein CONPUDRAFT_164812 [Coniophora puteana RWD-64-598 SS2]
MVAWLPLLLAPLPVLGALDKTHGVRPDLLARYAPQGSTWKCLDGSKEIAWSAVNDDYCDCPDGSDEPGTSACPNSSFYCRNAGHIGSSILSSRVNDGLCEPECCDGSDEKPGVCPNVCDEVGKEYRKKRDAERKMQKTGSKIRSTYIAYAHKEKTRLEGLIAELEKEVATREAEVARLREIAEHAESLSAADIEHKQKSPLYQSLLTHHTALKSLQREHKKHLEREKALGEVLDSLRTGYNPNYQDMAVLEAVRGWETLAGLPHINDVRKDESEGAGDAAAEGQVQEAEELEEGIWDAAKIEKELDKLLKEDHTSLLLQHDKHIDAPGPSILFDLSSYVPDSIRPEFEAFRDIVVSWLAAFGLAKPVDVSGSADFARQELSDSEHSLKLTENELKEARVDFGDIFDPKGFGPEGEWKKLDGLCLSKDTGDYTYEICLFDEAKQKPNKGGSNFSLGKFTSWDTQQEPGTPAYYHKQRYTLGAKCWNGPQRSVELVLECGIENALLSVAELEKCEYQITGTTPALCTPPTDDDATGKDEL